MYVLFVCFNSFGISKFCFHDKFLAHVMQNTKMIVSHATNLEVVLEVKDMFLMHS